MKGKEEVSEKMLTEKEANQLSDTEFKVMVIRKLTEPSGLTENYHKLQGNYNELTEKGNRNYQQGPRGNEEYNFRTEEHSRRNQKQT